MNECNDKPQVQELSRNVLADELCEESRSPEPKTPPVSEWRSMISNVLTKAVPPSSTTTTTTAAAAAVTIMACPRTPEPSQYDQSRDPEKTPVLVMVTDPEFSSSTTSNNHSNSNSEVTTPERAEPPTSPSDPSQFYSLMAHATDAWIVSQTSSTSTSTCTSTTMARETDNNHEDNHGNEDEDENQKDLNMNSQKKVSVPSKRRPLLRPSVVCGRNRCPAPRTLECHQLQAQQPREEQQQPQPQPQPQPQQQQQQQQQQQPQQQQQQQYKVPSTEMQQEQLHLEAWQACKTEEEHDSIHSIDSEIVNHNDDDYDDDDDKTEKARAKEIKDDDGSDASIESMAGYLVEEQTNDRENDDSTLRLPIYPTLSEDSGHTSRSVSFQSNAHVAAAMKTQDDVFIVDKQYSWLPAKVLERGQQSAIVSINGTGSWTDSTTLQDDDKPLLPHEFHESMKEVPIDERKRLLSKYRVLASQLRNVLYSVYENGKLPLQNDEDGKRDMADLLHLHFAAVLYNLKARHFHQKPYTRVGNIVIAMNPFAWIQDLYEPSTRDLYSKNLIWEAGREMNYDAPMFVEKKSIYDRLGCEPHVYEISALAYRGLATTGQDQTILVTGESGSGKTETVKIVMNHLATVQQSRPGGLPNEHSTAKEIVARVLDSSPVFEAFGNAKTVRNYNSSRFGKLTQLQFQVEPTSAAETAGRDVPFANLVGSYCTAYLLEKNRVVKHDEGERNFHIFYQLLTAPTDFKRNVWPSLSDRTAQDYAYTAGEIGSGIHDLEAWQGTISALATFHFQNDSLTTLMRALVIVLQLGNLIFEDDSTEDQAIIRNGEELNELAELTGIKQSSLRETLTSRTLKTPGGHEDIIVGLSAQQAKESCDALAKEIYAQIFEALVQKINGFTAYSETFCDGRMKRGHIALLDIFGFERFGTNRFEQLCINYANERLHYKYVSDNFNQVKEEYEAEGVDLFDFKLVDNSEILTLLEGSDGVIASLDEECVRPKGNEEAFVRKVKRLASAKLIDDKLHRKWEFGIQHFNGPVEYDAQDFVSKNTDKLPEGLIECAATCRNPIIGDAFKQVQNESSKASIDKKKLSNGTALQKFRAQLKSLLTAMEGSKTRYIRCIKPNAEMIPRKTNHTTTTQQLLCSGVVTALTFSRESYPNKLPYNIILDRYSCLTTDEDLQNLSAMVDQQKVEYILTKCLKLQSGSAYDALPFVCGRTKVFFKAGAQDALEQLRRQYYDSAATKIQTRIRRVNAQRLITRMKTSILSIQSVVRMAIARTRFQRQRQSATKVSSWWRGRWAVMLVQKLRVDKATLVLQAYARGYAARKEFQRRVLAANVLQRSFHHWRYCVRLLTTLKTLVEWIRTERTSATTIQARIRTNAARRRYQAKQKAIYTIQQAIRHWNESVRLRAALKSLAHHARSVREQEEQAATVIQAHARTSSIKKVFAQKKESVQVLQQSMPRQLQKDETNLSNTNTDEADSGRIHELQEMYRYLREEVALLRSEKKELQSQLKSSDTARKSLQNQVQDCKETISTYRSRIQGLVKANDSLVPALQAARNETLQLRQTLRTERAAFESKLSHAEQGWNHAEMAHRQEIEQLQKAIQESQDKNIELQRQWELEVAARDEKRKDHKKKLKEELSLVQKSHREQLTKLVDALESGQSRKQDEVSLITTELLAVRKEKDDQIARLQQEVKSLRVLTRNSHNDKAVRAALEPRSMQRQLERDNREHAQSAADFDSVCERLSSLISETCVLPRHVSEREMKCVIEQQMRGEKMNQLLETMAFLFRSKEVSRQAQLEVSIELIQEYIARTEPNRTVAELKERLAEVTRQASCLQEELKDKAYCKRCAIRDSAAQRGRRLHGNST